MAKKILVLCVLLAVIGFAAYRAFPEGPFAAPKPVLEASEQGSPEHKSAKAPVLKTLPLALVSPPPSRQDVVKPALIQQGSDSTAADAAQARARILDVLAHAFGALVLSRACPDDSPLADEVLAVSRQAILESLRPQLGAPTARAAKARRTASRRRSAG